MRTLRRERVTFWFDRKGMPLGNLTSQFLANVYLNKLDHFVKHFLRVKYYIRYVDDFIILHRSRKKLAEWKEGINMLLKRELKIELHQQKSRIVSMHRGVDFVGLRNFYYYKLLRKRNIKKMVSMVELFENKEIDFGTLLKSYKGWRAYARWANTYNLCEQIKGKITDILWMEV